ncbi:type IV secretion system protein VirB6 [Moraxella caprae]|uniref:Type IV secretion system protein VirB6 n=1 Tax=Moraxella caprae TaxID=90240 RepID=A0A378QM82_9GAMM|nr:type IV secretion system protein [Moraxella caprae]STY98639.1 type IV secretion system protein VirB6 [Moraxella caprae]STZ01592.1 type IV secretion system protein VirB6 [Moraxella caprae]
MAGFLSGAFDDVNSALSNFSSQFSSGVATEIAPLVAGGLTLSFIVIGIMAIRGLLDRPFMEVAWTLTKASIITSIALTTAVYQNYVIDVFLTLPDDLISSLVGNSISGADVKVGQGAAVAIEEMYDLGTSKAGLFFDQAAFSLTQGIDLLPILYGVLVWIGILLCCVIGLFWLIVAKVVLALMLGIGPFFICCLIWNPTQQFFWSWLGQVLNTAITSIFVLAVFAVFAAIFNTQLNELQVELDTANFANAAVFTFLGILCMGVLVAIPQYVSALTGAAGGAVGTAMSRISGGAISMGAGAAGGVLGAGRSAVAGYEAGKTYNQARAGGASRFQAARQARHTYNETKDDLKRGYPNYAKMGLNSQRNTPQGTGSYSGGAVPSVSFAKGKK